LVTSSSIRRRCLLKPDVAAEIHFEECRKLHNVNLPTKQVT
jgi:hypothetical protein